MPTEEITIEDLVNWYCEEHNIILWRDIEGFEGIYQVSNVGGLVKSLERTYASKGGGIHIVPEKILKPQLDKYGYPRVNLYKNRKMYHKLVSRLVAQAWVSNTHNYEQVNHIDECKTNNNAANLEWCDCKFNVNWGTAKNRRATTRGFRVQQYTLEGELIAEYVSASEAQRQTGIFNSQIVSCCNNKKDFKSAGGYVWKYA